MTSAKERAVAQIRGKRNGCVFVPFLPLSALLTFIVLSSRVYRVSLPLLSVFMVGCCCVVVADCAAEFTFLKISFIVGLFRQDYCLTIRRYQRFLHNSTLGKVEQGMFFRFMYNLEVWFLFGLFVLFLKECCF